MLKLQIVIGINVPGEWHDCKRLDKFVDGKWVRPTYPDSASLEAIVDATGDTFLHDCFHQGLLRLVKVTAPVAAKVTAVSLALFLAYAKDAGNWSGQPLVGGNVGGSKEDRGNLTQLKRAKLITTILDEGNTWVSFTEAGKALALEHGITI